MYALDRLTGEMKFRFLTCANVFSSAAIADNGMIYFGCNTVTAVSEVRPTPFSLSPGPKMQSCFYSSCSCPILSPQTGSANLGKLYAINPAKHL
jgi:hypothetical protein